MIRILFGLGIVATILASVSCSTSQKSQGQAEKGFPKEVLAVSKELGQLRMLPATTAKATAKAMAKPTPVADVALPAPQKISKLVGLSAASTEPYLGWVKTSVGFAQSEMTEDQLQSLGTPGLPYSWRVLKKWSDGSVRIGQIRSVAYFNGYGIQPVNLTSGNTPLTGFSWHPSVAQAIGSGQLAEQLKITTTANGTLLDCYPAAGHWKFLVVDAGELTVRFRSHCVDAATRATHPLSLTAWYTFLAMDPVARISFILGNDTREAAIGQINVNNVQVVKGNLPLVRWVNESAYGDKNTVLADGQTMAWKVVIAFDPAFDTTAAHIATGEPRGFQFWDDAKASNAFGTAPLPATRVTLPVLNQVHLEVTAQAAVSPAVNPKVYLGMINRNPPDTGGQPDFASTMPRDIQKASQAYSARQMAAVMLAVSRESYRPSFYWETRDNVEDWVKSTSYPDLFFWSGRPHFDFSWNTQYPQWQSRTGSFQAGNFGGWGGMDNQHYGNNHVRYAYELTGDVVLEDWLKYKLSEVTWNYFTDWLNHTEAERAFGRSTKEAIALTELFPDLPETALLKPRIQTKLQAQMNGTTNTITRFGHTGNNLFDGCDPRVNGAIWCPLQQQLGLGPIVQVGWQTGFVQEVWSMVEKPDLRYLAAAEEFFRPDGTPKTYWPITNPGDNTVGGIGIEWWSGWVQVALKNPKSPGADFVLKVVKPVMEARMQNGCGFPSHQFCLNDSWFAW